MQVFFSPSAHYNSAIDAYDPATGLGRYSGKTLEELTFEYGDVTIVDQQVAIDHDRQRNITPPRAITEDRFHDLLECLPPCKWGRFATCEAFHMSERITYDIATWCVRIGSSYYEFQDTDRMTAQEAIDKVAVHIEEQA